MNPDGRSSSCRPPSSSSTAPSPSRRAGTGVIDPLVAEGHRVVAAANPLRGLAADAASVSDLVRIDRGAGRARRALLRGRRDLERRPRRRRDRRARLRQRIRAGAPARTASGSRPGSRAACSARRRCGRCRAATGRPTSTSLRTASTTCSARTSPRQQAALMAATQRPATQEALVEPSGDHPLWKDVPSWFLIGKEDNAIRGPEAPALHGRPRRLAAHGRDRGRVARHHRLASRRGRRAGPRSSACALRSRAREVTRYCSG